MKYRNKNTGAIIDTESKLLGAWEEYSPSMLSNNKNSNLSKEIKTKNEEKTKEIKKQTKVKDKELFDRLTKAEIMQELNAFGIEYDKRANKETLFNLMMEGD